MSTLSGYLLIDNRAGTVYACPGKISEYDLPDVAARRAPPGGDMELFVPYKNSAFGDGAVVVRRVSKRQMVADAEALSHACTTNHALNHALDDAGYCHVRHWDADCDEHHTAYRLGRHGEEYELGGAAQ